MNDRYEDHLAGSRHVIRPRARNRVRGLILSLPHYFSGRHVWTCSNTVLLIPLSSTPESSVHATEPPVMRNPITILTLIVLFASGCSSGPEWQVLFDGSSMDGWRASENSESWVLEDGALVTNGPRSHLFYVGDSGAASFKNFEFRAEVKSTPGSNSGIFFHTEYQEEGWPSKGYEAQVINSNERADGTRSGERKMTGSLYGVRNTWIAPAEDGEWFDYHIVVQGKTIRISINDHLIVDYTEPAGVQGDKRLSEGTFALQSHDPKSTVSYRNIRVRALPDDLPTPGTPLSDQEFEEKMRSLPGNVPLLDLHAHLKGGLTMEEALENARKYGFSYGFAVNCGLQMGFETEEALAEYLDNYEQPPHTYHAMQAEGREWLDLFSREIIDRFDYVFTDAMTWTNDDGKRMRLWIPEETEVGDPQDFMEQLVDRTVRIISTEPIDIFVNPTYLPDEIADRYDELWTPDRMDRVITALVENDVALEINAKRQIPSQAYIQRAKEAGVKFTMGTNNAGADDLGRLGYPIAMVDSCGLTAEDFWFPGE